MGYREFRPPLFFLQLIISSISVYTEDKTNVKLSRLNGKWCFCWLKTFAEGMKETYLQSIDKFCSMKKEIWSRLGSWSTEGGSSLSMKWFMQHKHSEGAWFYKKYVSPFFSGTNLWFFILVINQKLKSYFFYCVTADSTSTPLIYCFSLFWLYLYSY